jgi:hypothetical protein
MAGTINCADPERRQSMAEKGQLLPDHDPAMIGWNAPKAVVRRTCETGGTGR